MTTTNQSTITALQERRYADAEASALGAVRTAPLDAQGWVLLGEALLHQGFGLAARAVFDRAWLLDPEAAWVPDVHAALQRVQPGPPRSDIDALLRVKPVRVAAGIIAGNEEAVIDRCLRSLQGAVDEIVLVDSSTDNTAAVASRFPGVKIVRAEWQHDFAKQRNIGLQHIESDWVLWIDADETLHPDDVQSLRTIAGLFDDTPLPAVLHVWHLHEVNNTEVHDFSQTRFFPVHKGLEFRGRIHEQVALQGEELYGEGTYRRMVRLRLRHDGYEPSEMQRKNKLQRNLQLIEQMMDDEPWNPGWFMYHGRESLAAGLTEQALNSLQIAEEKAHQTPRFGRILEVYKLQAQLHAKDGRLDEAEQCCRRALKTNPDYPDARFMLATIQMQKAYELSREAGNHLQQVKSNFRSYRGTVSPDHSILQWKADRLFGELAMRQGKLSIARDLFAISMSNGAPKEEMQKKLESIEEQRRKLNEAIKP